MFAIVDFFKSKEQPSSQNQDGIHLYPNPINKSINIEFSSPKPQTFADEKSDLDRKLGKPNFIAKIAE